MFRQISFDWDDSESEPVCHATVWAWSEVFMTTLNSHPSFPPYLPPTFTWLEEFSFLLSGCLFVCIHLSFNFHNFPVLTSHQNSPLQSQVFSFTFLILITNQAGFHYIILLPTFMPRDETSTDTTNAWIVITSLINKALMVWPERKPEHKQCNVKSSLKVWLLIKILFDNPQHHQSPLLTSWPDKVRKLESVISVQMLKTLQKLNRNNCNCSNISGLPEGDSKTYWLVPHWRATRWFRLVNIINTS